MPSLLIPVAWANPVIGVGDDDAYRLPDLGDLFGSPTLWILLLALVVLAVLVEGAVYSLRKLPIREHARRFILTQLWTVPLANILHFALLLQVQRRGTTSDPLVPLHFLILEILVVLTEWAILKGAFPDRKRLWLDVLLANAASAILGVALMQLFR